jgi:hypothetical protein
MRLQNTDARQSSTIEQGMTIAQVEEWLHVSRTTLLFACRSAAAAGC